MTGVPPLSAIEQMSELELMSVYARIFNAFAGKKNSADEQAQMMMALQQIRKVLRERSVLRL